VNRHHHHFRATTCFWRDHDHIIDRRPRRFHGGSGALAARPRRRRAVFDRWPRRAQSERSGRQADKYRVRASVSSQDGRIGRRLQATFDQIISARSHPVRDPAPIGSEDKFLGVVDLIKMKAITYKDETMGADYIVADIPEDMLEGRSTTASS